MTQEQTFRLVAAAVILLAAPVGAYHRHRAARVGAKVTRAAEPWPIRVPLRVCGLAGFAMFFVWMFRPAAIAWGQVALPPWARWAGVAIALAAVPLLAWTFHTLGHNLTDTVATRANSYLVTTGPYRWVRHPFYVVVALYLAGLSLLSALWAAAVLAGVVLALLAIRTPLEERKLIERFGDDYRAYAARTGRFLPRVPRRPAGRLAKT